MKLFAPLLFATIAAAPLAAQDQVFSPEATEACLARISAPALFTTCIGASANQCMDDTPGGYSTVGMSGCLEQERLYWDARLNAAYKEVRDEAEKIDTELSDLGSSAPRQADALRDMQRAWIAFRDATCDYERSLWGGGTGGGPATVSCHMYMTAEQARYLETAGLGD